MRRFITTAAVLAIVCLVSSTAQAGPYGYGYGGYGGGYGGYRGGWGGGYRQPIYHAPSVHFDRVYHPTYSHWTPGRGYHTHGHYDVVPHVTPGHFDTLHNNHIHTNPWYHH